MATSSGGTQFTFSIPTNIVFGMGALESIGTHAKALGFTRPLIVTDKVMAQSDGRFLGRRKVDEDGIRSPMVVADNLLYVLGNGGKLAALAIEPKQ